MSTTLPLFWHLSSASKNERLDASVKLIGALEHFQSQKEVATAESSDDDEDDQENVTSKFKDNLDLLNAQDVSYSIRRLIRGLASPRESSRLGFAVALTELLSRLCTVTCSQIMGLIMDSTKHQGSMKGQEERDILFARLFGISSIIQSGLAVRTKPIPDLSSSETSTSSLESYEQIISSLLSLGDEKSWLRESAWFTINLAVDSLQESEVAWREKAVQKTLDALFTTNSVWSTEKLALTLKLQDFFPMQNWKGYLSPLFKNTDILSTGNLAIVAKILKESATDEDRAKDPTKAPSGGWKPQLNFSWGIILDQLLPGPNSEKEPKGSFQDFYKIVVDETLFSATASANRKYWGFQVFQNALKKADQETVPMLFTRNFMRTWINHLSKRDRYLHKIALQTATEVESFVKSKPQFGFGLILQLTGTNGSQQFDKLTKTKTVESILSVLDVKGVEQYVDHLLSQANESGVHTTDVGAINSRRAWIIDQLASTIRNQRLPRSDTWIKNILDWLTIHGLFMIKKKSSKIPFPVLRSIPSPPLSDELRQSCREKLLACLGDLCHQVMVVTEGESTRKIHGVASDGEFWLSKVLSDIRQLEQDTKHVVLLEEVDEETIGLRVKAWEVLDSLKTSKAGREATKGAELLLLGTLLIHFCDGDDDSVKVADPLEVCVDGVTRLLTSEAREKGGDSESEPVDLFVDTIIGFLEKGTSYSRSIGNLSFGLLSGLVKESTIDLIVMQLERRDPSQLLGEDEDDEMEVAESVGSEDEESGSDESEASDSDDSPDPSVEGEADLELRQKIEEALRVNGIEPATGETDSEDEELMDDDQMMAIDDQLAQVFRARANEKKGKNLDVHREATHFKSRVLDLVDTYLKNEPTSPLTLCFISPLVELALASGQDERQLADKAKGVLRSRLGKAKESVNGADPAQILEISTTIHTMARRARSSDNLAVLNLCAVFLAKASIHAGHEESLVDLYKEDLHDFTRRKKSGLNGAFFQEFIKKYPLCGWRLREDLLNVLKGTINTYRQTQVIQLLQLLLSLSPSFNVSEDEVKKFMPLLRQQLFEIVEDACKDSGDLTTAQMKEVLKLVLLGVRQTARIATKATGSLWKSDTWRSLTETFDASPRFKSSPVLKKQCKRIAQMIDSSSLESPKQQSKKKRKADVLEANQNSKKKHKSDS